MTFKKYRELWAHAHIKTPPIPLSVDIELSAVCNLRCPFCFLSNPEHKQPYKFMPLDLAIQTINAAHKLGVPAIKLNWRGESTLHPEFSNIAEYAASMGFHEILLNTNGNYGEMAQDGLMACTKVMFSLDSMAQLTYRKMRPGGNLMRVINNIQRLVDLGHKNIWVRRVITDLNKNEDFAGAVRPVFGDKVKVSEHYCFDRVNEQDRPANRVYCGYPSQRLVVSCNGWIYPCCVDYDCTMPLGEAPDLEAAWNGPYISNIRIALKNNHIMVANACKNCTSWMAYKSPKREKVKDIAI